MKKLWISIKRGLIREPKHRIAMGECVWLFQYMIDVADWDTGKIFGWKDEAAADDMQMPIRTLREQRRKLESLDYIVCTQKQYDQEIAITNWTNPREYSGEVYNPKQGDSKAEPSENSQSDTQGYTQDDTQGSTPDVTPTFNPNNQIPNTPGFSFPEPTPTKKQGDLVDGWLALSQSPGIKRQARIDAILSVLAERLHVRTTGKRWEEFAKLVDDRQQNFGEKLDVFLDWLTNQKGFNPQFWPPDRMGQFWPQAFVNGKPKTNGRSLPEIG